MTVFFFFRFASFSKAPLGSEIFISWFLISLTKSCYSYSNSTLRLLFYNGRLDDAGLAIALL